MHNRNSLDTLAAALAHSIRIEAPKCAAPANPDLVAYVDEKLPTGADRIFMYNPDAIGEWVYRKHIAYLKEVTDRCDIELPMERRHSRSEIQGESGRLSDPCDCRG